MYWFFVLLLLLTHAGTHRILLLYFRGAKKKPYLTTEQLVLFLNNRQRDPRLNEILFPYYNKERAEAFIHAYEGNAGFANQGKINLTMFFIFIMA